MRSSNAIALTAIVFSLWAAGPIAKGRICLGKAAHCRISDDDVAGDQCRHWPRERQQLYFIPGA